MKRLTNRPKESIPNRMVILIITKDHPKKLSRILLSIKNNPFLARLNILLIDNSNKKENVIANDKIIMQDKSKIVYINKFYWEGIRQLFIQMVEGKWVEKLLNKIDLGTKTMDIHHARNIGALICCLLYDDSDLILCFDDDMVIPKRFKINRKEISYPKSIPLQGSPDLSRLEWIKLYIRLLEKRNIGGGRDHISRIINNFSYPLLKQIIANYTNLTKDKIKNYLIDIPVREELNAGSFVCKNKDIYDEIYPPWFNNDWFWFRRNRKKNNYPLGFIKKSVVHLSSKKDVLDRKMLKFEEIGEIIITLLKNKSRGYIPDKKEIINEIEKKIDLISLEIERSKKALLMNRDQRTKQKLLDIIFCLNYLISSLKLINPKRIRKQILFYEENSNQWGKLIKNIKKDQHIKEGLFKILKKPEILIFSPHCDDVMFSIGGAILNGYFKNINPYIFYTNSMYCLQKSKIKTAKDITKIRLHEELRTFKKLGVCPIFLKFDDATLREYSCEEAYLSKKNNPKEDSSFVGVRERVYRIIKNKKDKILLFPLGLGYNIDHRVLSNIGVELSKIGYLVLFYEDIGYDMTKRDNLIKDYIREEKLDLTSRTFYFKDIKNKMKFCKMYKTQISRELLNDIMGIAINRGGERIWSTKEVFKQLNL